MLKHHFKCRLHDFPFKLSAFERGMVYDGATVFLMRFKGTIDVNMLQKAVQNVLDLDGFYFCTGKLIRDKKTRECSVIHPNADVDEAMYENLGCGCVLCVQEDLEHSMPHELEHLNFNDIPVAYTIRADSAPDDPLVGIKVTMLKDGGSVMVLAVNHKLLDGFSVAKFLTRVDDRMRGVTTCEPLVFSRNVLDDSCEHAPADKVISMPPELAITPEYKDFMTSPSPCKYFYVRVHDLELLKRECGGVSLNSALSAWLWTIVTRAKDLERSMTIRFSTVVNLRAKILPANYIGNGFTYSHCTAIVSEMHDSDCLAKIGTRIHASVKAIDAHYWTERLQWYRTVDCTTQYRDACGGSGLGITNYSQLTSMLSSVTLGSGGGVEYLTLPRYGDEGWLGFGCVHLEQRGVCCVLIGTLTSAWQRIVHDPMFVKYATCEPLPPRIQPK